jgi:hypothetical protein|tara:strand:+ start:1836 stop:2384 length:549 start_codon:yes stop_codon:yes gene_type:complete
MPLKITLPSATQEEEVKPPQATIGLRITKTLDGNLLIDDHQYLDILVVPPENKIICMPKPFVEKDVYDYQKELMQSLFKGGITNAGDPQAAAQFGVMETTYPAEGEGDPLQVVLLQLYEFFKRTEDQDSLAQEYDKNIEDRFTDPTPEDSTAYGEILPYQDTPEGSQISDSTYTFAGWGYMY